MKFLHPETHAAKITFPLTAVGYAIFTAAITIGLLGGFSAAAAETTTGVIEGRVLNAQNGTYLGKARVTVAGTTLETFTNDFGEFRLDQVPTGEVRLDVSYIGLPPKSDTLVLRGDETVKHDVQLGGDSLRRKDGAVVLDQFVVESQRYKSARDIAINEERYSPTLKNVVAADAFGDIPDGNIGEFVKYIPGVQIDYGYSGTGLNAADNNATSISVRGFGPEMTSITIDGVPLTNASPATLTRAVGLDMMSINNASRVEVIKVPTPDMPSNSPGGSINLITKSSFEYAKPTLNWSTSLNVNSENTDHLFKKTPGPANEATYKTLPGATLSYVFPLSRTMGVAVTGAWSKTFNENHRALSDWFYDTKDISSGSSFSVDLRPGGGPLVQSDRGVITTPLASADGDQPLNLAAPLLWRYQVADTPNTVTRTSGSLRFDWRPTAAQKITVGYTLGLFDAVDAQRRLQFNAAKGYTKDWGADFATSYAFLPRGTIVNGAPLGADFNPGATVNQTVTTRDRAGSTHTAYIDYMFKRGPWSIDANLNGSRSRGSYSDVPNGHFSELETTLTLGQLAFRNIRDAIPGRIELADRAGAPLD